MASYSEAGYGSLGQQLAIILALATFAWCASRGMGLIEALFRMGVVYFVVSIFVAGVSRFVTRAINQATVEKRIKQEQMRAAESEQNRENPETGGNA